MADATDDRAYFKFPPPFYLLAPLLVAWGIQTWVFPWSFGWLDSEVMPWMNMQDALGLICILLGFALTMVSSMTLKRSGNTASPFTGTNSVASQWPYSFSRNPIYLGASVIYLGLAFISGSLWILISMPLSVIMMDRFIIRHEESYLEEKFGETYLAYKASVRRWL